MEHTDANLIKVFFKILNTIKIFHWQTSIHSHHLVSDTLHTTLSGLFDQVIENRLGQKVLGLEIIKFELSIDPVSDLVPLLKKFKSYIEKILPQDATRDDIITAINKAVYLLKMK